MKKILIFTNHSYMLWQFRKELIVKLMEENEVVLCMPFVGHEDDFKLLGLKCIETAIDRRGINPITDFKLLKQYKKILKSEKPDQVITYSIKPNIYAGFLCGRMHIPFYANVQGLGTAFQKPVLAAVVTLMYRTVFKKVRKVFFENTGNAKEFRKRHILKKEQQVVLKGAGINLDYYAYKPYPTNEKVHFLYLGRIMKEKGMDELFAAIDQLKKDGEPFAIDFLGFFEDEYKAQVDAIEKQGLGKFYGFKEDPRPYYEDTDCTILPSYHEGMSNVLLEASATGRPLITSNIPGCKEAVTEGKNGFLVSPKDTKSLYCAMKKMIALSRSKRAQMGLYGRKKMEREFDKEQVVLKTIRALKD
ncbi:Undecaprenyl-phosphate galactosephosphotransferase [Lachnospiraceae bacterium TWA4]|nr:Undecaprenyl-phosphate galactosephosphotransferase [Lachnospiraceae bacterium TWA4]